MAASLYLLRDFFKAGRNHHGGYMGENEDMVNATERNLSLFTDAEILALRASAWLFVEYCERTIQERAVVDDEDPRCEHCGAFKPAGQSCICVDNGGQ